ncbi:hypothetical protein VNI00_006650 [Paramarasmius palmivorus]|uniref:Uncharacterized protein n=1 Tax=Paramarasmius palmivorus TaxID=297713 RepID=A0AAW0D8H9_9AGAR
MSFHAASQFSIHGGQFTYVAGSVHNNVEGNLVQHIYRIQEEEDSTLWDDYEQISTGKIYLKKTLLESSVNAEIGWNALDARRTISIARIRGEDKEEEFLHVGYSGRDAFETFKRDFDKFSRIKNANVAQLFGYNKRRAGVPALIFYDALVPVANVFDRNHYSSILYTYFNYQVGVAQISDGSLTLNNLWVHPSGELRTGPYVRDGSTRLWSFSKDSFTGNDQFLTIPAFNNTELILEYLARKLPARQILRGICRSSQLIVKSTAVKDAAFMLATLPGAIYSKTTGQVVARSSEDNEKWYYGQWAPWGLRGSLPDVIKQSKVVTADDAVRFTVPPTDIPELKTMSVLYGLWPRNGWDSFADSWLAQAHSVFNQRGISERDYGEYANLRGFWFDFERDEQTLPQNPAEARNDRPAFLFIRPVPRPADGESAWKAWSEKKKYFWSYDASGQEKMSEERHLALGLPSFNIRMRLSHTWWSNVDYNDVKRIHAQRRFDPTTTDLCRSLNFPVLVIIGDENRFVEIEDDDLPDEFPPEAHGTSIVDGKEDGGISNGVSTGDPSDAGDISHLSTAVQEGKAENGILEEIPYKTQDEPVTTIVEDEKPSEYTHTKHNATLVSATAPAEISMESLHIAMTVNSGEADRFKSIKGQSAPAEARSKSQNERGVWTRFKVQIASIRIFKVMKKLGTRKIL